MKYCIDCKLHYLPDFLSVHPEPCVAMDPRLIGIIPAGVSIRIPAAALFGAPMPAFIGGIPAHMQPSAGIFGIPAHIPHAQPSAGIFGIPARIPHTQPTPSVSVRALLTSGVSVSALFSAGVSIVDLIHADVSIDDLIRAGISIEMIVRAISSLTSN